MTIAEQREAAQRRADRLLAMTSARLGHWVLLIVAVLALLVKLLSGGA